MRSEDTATTLDCHALSALAMTVSYLHSSLFTLHSAVKMLYNIAVEFFKKLFFNIKGGLLVLFFAFKDARTPFLAKALSLIAFVYLVLPIDIIPDFIFPAGYLDDFAIAPLLLYFAHKKIPPEVLEEAKTSSDKINKTAKTAGKIAIASAAVSAILFIVFVLLLLKFIFGVKFL